ncbi:MAG: helix-turn-helix transcriptional regulator [Planctomycetota bacterium]
MPKSPPDTRRDLFRASSDVLVLSVLADGPIHGYAIQRQLQHTLGKTLPAGSLYPLLHRLASESWIISREATHRGRPRRVYELTAEGRRHLRRSAANWQAMIAQLQSLVLPAVRRVATQSSS